MSSSSSFNANTCHYSYSSSAGSFPAVSPGENPPPSFSATSLMGSSTNASSPLAPESFATQMNSFFSTLLYPGGSQPSPDTTKEPEVPRSTPMDSGGNRPVFCAKRLTKEKKDLLTRPPDCVSMKEPEQPYEWFVTIKGAEGTLYNNEEFQLRFRFPERYPLDSPEVMFVGIPPVHPHVYSNGHICLSILYDGWSPALSVTSICLSLISMLSSCKRKERPPDNGVYVRMSGPHVSPKHMRWVFHDDTV